MTRDQSILHECRHGACHGHIRRGRLRCDHFGGYKNRERRATGFIEDSTMLSLSTKVRGGPSLLEQKRYDVRKPLQGGFQARQTQGAGAASVSPAAPRLARAPLDRARRPKAWGRLRSSPWSTREGGPFCAEGAETCQRRPVISGNQPSPWAQQEYCSRHCEAGPCRMIGHDDCGRYALS